MKLKKWTIRHVGGNRVGYGWAECPYRGHAGWQCFSFMHDEEGNGTPADEFYFASDVDNKIATLKKEIKDCHDAIIEGHKPGTPGLRSAKEMLDKQRADHKKELDRLKLSEAILSDALYHLIEKYDLYKHDDFTFTTTWSTGKADSIERVFQHLTKGRNKDV